MRKRPKGNYSPRVRARALALAQRIGAAAAARQLDLPSTAIYRWRKAAGATTNHTTGAPDAAQLDQTVAFIFGETKARLAGYAEGLGLPPAVLTARVAKLLLAAARGPVLGLEHRLPAVRGGAAR